MKTARMLGIATLIALGLFAAAAPAEAAPHRPRTSLHITWGPGWGWWGPAWYGPAWGYPRVYPNPAYGNFGALDTDVSPERAEVWVDGKRVGLADDFDGYPNFLWLEKGTYDVVFYLPGHRTLARQYSIYPGLVIDVEDRLEKGEAVHPLDLGPRSTERRDARIRAEEEQRLRVERQLEEEEREPYGTERPQDWEERSPEAVDGGEATLDARAERAQEGGGMRGACADFHVVGLEQGTALLVPVGLQGEDDLLEGQSHFYRRALWLCVAKGLDFTSFCDPTKGRA